MKEPYRLPKAKVLSIVNDNDVTTCMIDISDEHYLCYPIAPCNLQDGNGYVFPFHQLVAREKARLTFETYETQYVHPNVNAEYEFLSNWLPDAMDAVRDLDTNWVYGVYPDNNDHDHCLLTYMTISAKNNHKSGYCSKYGWVTVKAYKDFIEKDQLRVRNHCRSIEVNM
jgi:hypothetical protein